MSKITFVNRGRGQGKTIEAIKRANATGAVIVCLNHKRVEHILETAHRINLNIHRPISFRDFQNYGGYLDRDKKIIIEDADEIFMSLLNGYNVEMITFDIDQKRDSIIC